MAITARRPLSARQNYNYTVDYGCGVDPVESEFQRPGHLIATGTPGAAITGGTLATWAIGGVSADCGFGSIVLPVADRDQYDETYNVTIRVQVVDDLGNIGEDRKVVSVHHDPT